MTERDEGPEPRRGPRYQDRPRHGTSFITTPRETPKRRPMELQPGLRAQNGTTSARPGGGHPLRGADASGILEPAVDPRTLDQSEEPIDGADRRVVLREKVDRPAPAAPGGAGVDAVAVVREIGSVVAAGARPKLRHNVLPVVQGLRGITTQSPRGRSRQRDSRPASSRAANARTSGSDPPASSGNSAMLPAGRGRGPSTDRKRRNRSSTTVAEPAEGLVRRVEIDAEVQGHRTDGGAGGAHFCRFCGDFLVDWVLTGPRISTRTGT